MRKSNTFKIFRNCFLYTLFVIGLLLMLCDFDSVSTITSYNIQSVKSLQTSYLIDKYVPPKKEAPKVAPAIGPVTKYRLTSFYPNDELKTGDCTGSGLCSWDFGVNEKGWYTYNGKLVLASATTYLQKQFGTREGVTYYKYYDEVNITIDGVVYPGIILDTCGACYKDDRLDLFVKNKDSVIDRGYMGRNMVSVQTTKKK